MSDHTAATPRRSALYMPGSSARALEKARDLPADVLILDLEDAVSPDRKREARTILEAALTQGGYGPRELLIRVNALDGPWGADDLAWAARQPVQGVILPKVDTPATVLQAIDMLETAGAAKTLAVWCMIETPLGILRADPIASSSARLAGLIAGTSDLAKDLRAAHRPGREPLLMALSLIVLAARAHGRACLDGVHLDLDDIAGLADAARQGADLGFDGKTLIHPKQISVVNAAYSPSADSLAWSRRIIAAFAEARAGGSGVAVVDGKLVEQLHVDEANRLLAIASAIDARVC